MTVSKANIHIPHNTIHKVLKANNIARDDIKKRNRRKWIRYERAYSNSLWHADYKQLNDKWLIMYQDDASRFIVGYNNKRPHMALDWDNLETPSKAYVRKMPKDGIVIDKQSGEIYEVKRE